MALPGTGLGSASFAAGDLDSPSHGGTITFQQIGAAGWYPSRRDPATGPCDAQSSATCCMTEHDISGTQMTPWDEELIMTLRGPLEVKQVAVYQPGSDATAWNLVSAWSDAAATARSGLAFATTSGDPVAFAGSIGTECLVNVSTDRVFTCGPGSVPYCPPVTGTQQQYEGWQGGKLFIVLARASHAGDVPGACSTTTTGNWYDAPWLGLSHGELVRAGAFVSCQCYAKDPTKSYLADGCGQFNVFEVVNDNDSSKNLDVYSTNMIGYGGYVGQGPCGPACGVTALDPAVDLIDKAADREAATGALATPAGGPTAAFRRPAAGYRYFVVLLDVATRTIQLALIHPDNIPAAAAGLLPALPAQIDRPTIERLLAMRLPAP